MTACLLLAIAPARAAVPAAITEVIRDHCVRCHSPEGDSALDLTTPPDERDVKTWRRILEMVESSRMPPAAKGGSIAGRFPLDPGIRQRFVSGIQALLGGALGVPPPVPQIEAEVWRAIVTRFVGDTVDPKALAGAFGGMLEAEPPEPLYPLARAMLFRTSEKVCALVAAGDLARPRAARRFFAGVPAASARLSRGSALRLVQDLYAAVFEEKPSPAELEAGAALLVKLRASVVDWSQAWSGLCVSYLAGPRLQHLSYVGTRP